MTFLSAYFGAVPWVASGRGVVADVRAQMTQTADPVPPRRTGNRRSGPLCRARQSSAGRSRICWKTLVGDAVLMTILPRDLAVVLFPLLVFGDDVVAELRRRELRSTSHEGACVLHDVAPVTIVTLGSLFDGIADRAAHGAGCGTC